MAAGYQFVCNGCGKKIEAWDEGNPFYIDEWGKKRYAYHPDHENRDRCIGNDSPHLCLSCAQQFVVDSRKPSECCPKCSSSAIADVMESEGKDCPFCKGGVFAKDFYAIS